MHVIISLKPQQDPPYPKLQSCSVSFCAHCSLAHPSLHYSVLLQLPLDLTTLASSPHLQNLLLTDWHIAL